MANEVTWYDSSEAGAPTLNNAAGALLAVIQACLVDGFNSKSVTSLVVASNVATATCSAHGFTATVGKLILMAGATPSGLNGIKQITSVATNTFTYAAPGISNQTATGTITVKRNPLGWTRPYSGTNKAMYARSDPAASAEMLRIDDTATGIASTTYARAIGVESATDVDTYVAEMPTTAALSGGSYWSKGANTATAKPWVIFGDSRSMYLLLDNAAYTFAANGALCPHGFGDLVPYRAGDPYRAFIMGSTNNSGPLPTNAFAPNMTQGTGPSATYQGFHVARAANGVGGAIQLSTLSNWTSVPGISGPVYPSGVDNGAVIQRPVIIMENVAPTGYPFRGELPGLALPMAAIGNRLHLQVLPNPIGFTGNMVCVGATMSQPSAPLYGALLFDVTGPWQ